MKYQLKKTKPYELGLTVTLDKVDLDYYLNEARKSLTNDLKIKGFRKGKAPPDLVKDKLDKKQVLETAFDLAFKQSFASILFKENLELIDAGTFEIKENSPEKVIFSVLLTVFPELRLGNYKSIPVKQKDASVSEEEIDKTVEFIRSSKKVSGTTPILNDDFAKSLGHFKGLKELKESVREGLKEEKQVKESQRVQAAILDKVAEDTKIEIPSILIERQLDQMMLDFDSDLHRSGMELGPFLSKIKKTKDGLRNEWKPKARVLVKKALILKEIAKKESIKVESEEIKERVNQFLGSFIDIGEAQKNIDLPKLSDQIRQVLLNQKVLAFLGREAVYIS